ncbi:MAG: transposase [Polyangiaceae bacterium]
MLSREKRIAVLAALVEGNSERAVERMTDVNRETVGRLALSFGLGAQRLHDRIARDLSCTQVVADETWSYVGVKEARVREDHPEGSGEAYTFVALDKTSRFVITWRVGKRDAASTEAFIADLRARLLVMPTIVTDGFVPYVAAVGAEFGPSVDFAQTVKNYRSAGRRDDHRYEPPRGIDFITKKTVYGAPDLASASTAYIERQNATMRHKIGRTRRLVYAFSKRIENHIAAVALNMAWYNLGTIVRTLRVTPAIAAGVVDRVFTIEDFHDAITAEVEPVAKPEKKALTHRAPPPETTARALPNGRGFLRALPGGGGPKGPGLAPAPGPRPPAAPAAPAPALREAPQPRQLDLFEWHRPKDDHENQPE